MIIFGSRSRNCSCRNSPDHVYPKVECKRCFHVLGSISFALFFSFNSIHADRTIEDSENLKKHSSFPIAVFCENRLTAFTVSDNTCLVSSSSLIYEDVTEEVCLRMCSSNRDSNGRTILCASAVYDHATFTCTIFRSRSYPDGDLKTVIAPGQRLFEKFCLKDAPSECADSRFLKVEQSVIIGYAKNVSMARSIEECIEQCLTEHFQCRSAMYFYTEGECITNTESAMTQPTSFAREESDKVIYIQNGCPAILARQKELENSTAAATELSPTSADEHTEDVNVETEAISSTTTTNEEIKEEEELKNTGVVNSSIEENTLKKQNDLNDRIRNDSYEGESENSFGTDSGKLASFDKTTASTTEEIMEMLKRNLKKLPTDSSTFNSNKGLKSLKQTKLQQIKKEFTSEESEENHMAKNLPLEVRPSPFQVENQHIEKTNSVVVVVHEGSKIQKPIKRLKIITLSGFEDEDHFSQWSNWSPCRRSGERKIRRRKCYNLQKCVGALMEVKKCPETVQGEPEFRAVMDSRGLRTAVNKKEELTWVPAERLNFANKTDIRTGGIRLDISSLQQSHSEKEPTEKTDEMIWSPWRGICQEVNGSTLVFLQK
ncbi:unnamed protein product [Acanthocheilonema viteae]|uniref:Apple domain-containing protein n=1 Tax=Acanthocheilonema viteae TaxID=6277 RepID=A0A498SUD5_ACAVI|nr:unnamed protein product [Acanthocheilonema viteae]